MLERTGGCQCGKVRYRVTGEPVTLAICHCTECQKQSGSAFGMSLVIAREHLVLTSGELKCFERGTDSGRRLRCYFCPECGNRIYHENAALPATFNVKAGTLDDTAWLAPKLQVWCDHRQPWLANVQQIPGHDRQPF